uniref:Rap-GAP domain-containing protein n=1 Tax=Ciona savignyi TaxID=51511 RepID=H2ZQ53_CIOSA
MYEEWVSLENEVLDLLKCQSVLHSYPSNVGRDVAKSVVACLAASQSTQRNEISTQLETNTQIKWTMEVICFGLSLSLSEYETLRDSVSIYLNWLSVAWNPKASIPQPLRDEPLPYVRTIIFHLQNIFVIRPEGSMNNQLSLCQTVLRSIQSLAHESKIIDRETWEAILMFILKVSNVLLAPPSQPNGLAEQLCEQLMHTMFDVWMLSCWRCFPTPSMWKTARIMVAGWRHHSPVVEWWAKVTSALTARLLTFMYGPEFPPYKIPDEDMKYIPAEMNNEQIAQSWFRMLHIISDPVELSNSSKFSKTPIFMERSLKSDTYFDASQHPCLRLLPYIFLKAMKGVSSLVDAFLVFMQVKKNKVDQSFFLPSFQFPPSSPLPSSTSPNSNQLSSQSSTQPSTTPDMHPHPTPLRPQVNSVLHLFGEWLFDAALASCKFEKVENRGRTPSGAFSTTNLLPVSPPSDMVTNPMFDGSEFPESSDAGRAEACGALCRLMCCKKTGEHILPVYLSRFYLVMSQGLLGDSKQVIASILLNSVDLMRIDLPGVTCLLPALLSTLESILPDRDLQHYKPYLNTTELRRAAIHLLISMVPLPLHYNTLEVEVVLWTPSGEKLTFQSVKKRLLELLIGALQCETDAINTQMILGALLLALHDSALFESLGESAKPKGEPLGVVQPNENEVIPVGKLISSCNPTAPFTTVPCKNVIFYYQWCAFYNILITVNSSVKKLTHTAYGLFVQIINLVSQRLDAWKSDISISLSALELLSGLAKANINMEDSNECLGAVHGLCQYIVHQCERPPPQHKRELHSMIVSAFHTLSVWLTEHPYLMHNKTCLNEVLEIIELGISGSKSKSDETSVMKADKELNPVSMRVLEAAEGLLIIVFEHLGAFPSPCSPASTCSLLDERLLLAHASGGRNIAMNEAVSRFRYFGLHNGALLSILEENLGNEQEPVPTVTMIIRSSSGRKVWTSQLRQTPRYPMTPDLYLAQPQRPKPLHDQGAPKRPKYRTFPEEVDRIPLVNADCSIPLLCDVPDPEVFSVQIEKLHNLIEAQKLYDDEISKQVAANAERMPGCSPLAPTNEFQAARLILSHMNQLTLDSVKAKPQARLGPDLVMLSSNDFAFSSDLVSLDATPTRNQDTVFVFYVKSGQTDRQEILNNVSNPGISLHPTFGEFLLSLGWPVSVATHPGWNGRSSSGLNPPAPPADPINLNEVPPGVFSGSEYILYYADCGTEVAFIVPRLAMLDPEPHDGVVEEDGVDSHPSTKPKLTLDLTAAAAVVTQFYKLSQESPTSPTGSVGSRGKKTPAPNRPNVSQNPDARVALVWAESYDLEDYLRCKLEKLQPLQMRLNHITDLNSFITSIPSFSRIKDAVIIFIHPLESGLFRIYVKGQNALKGGVAVPLVSGMVVSRRGLGPAVRMTCMNICERRRLASDSYIPPHVKRKQAINELFNKYQRRCTEPVFFTSVFTDVT